MSVASEEILPDTLSLPTRLPALSQGRQECLRYVVRAVSLSLTILLLFLTACHTSGVSVLPTALPVVQEPAVADIFDFPLDPAHFGPYIPYVSGPVAVDTRFGAQNPGVGHDGKCFVNAQGENMPFDQLYHAGEDWFALDAQRKVQGRAAASAPVHAVANGAVIWLQSLGGEGAVLIIEHKLAENMRSEIDGDTVWSVYWHVSEVQVAVGEAVTLGQVIAEVHPRGHNSHLHWEIRTFADGSALFPADSAGGRGNCNVYVMGVGYTWDDDPERAVPEAWGYLDPVAFVNAHRTSQ